MAGIGHIDEIVAEFPHNASRTWTMVRRLLQQLGSKCHNGNDPGCFQGFLCG